MKLWVDDVRPAPDESWTVARTAEEAIRYLAKFNFTEISLDHDDDADHFTQRTFQPVAYFVGINNLANGRSPTLKPKIAIHSINPVGAKQLQDILKDYGLDSILAPYQLEDFNQRYGVET